MDIQAEKANTGRIDRVTPNSTSTNYHLLPSAQAHDQPARQQHGARENDSADLITSDGRPLPLAVPDGVSAGSLLPPASSSNPGYVSSRQVDSGNPAAPHVIPAEQADIFAAVRSREQQLQHQLQQHSLPQLQQPPLQPYQRNQQHFHQQQLKQQPQQQQQQAHLQQPAAYQHGQPWIYHSSIASPSGAGKQPASHGSSQQHPGQRQRIPRNNSLGSLHESTNEGSLLGERLAATRLTDGRSFVSDGIQSSDTDSTFSSAYRTSGDEATRPPLPLQPGMIDSSDSSTYHSLVAAPSHFSDGQSQASTGGEPYFFTDDSSQTEYPRDTSASESSHELHMLGVRKTAGIPTASPLVTTTPLASPAGGPGQALQAHGQGVGVGSAGWRGTSDVTAPGARRSPPSAAPGHQAGSPDRTRLSGQLGQAQMPSSDHLIQDIPRMSAGVAPSIVDPSGRAHSRPHTEAGGYDLNFVEPLKESNKCPICSLALRDPLQSSCGCRFCKTCIDPIMSAVEHARCPVDNDIIDGIFHDRCCEREVLSLFVRCNNSLNGCEWTGQVRALQTHMETCKYNLVHCPNRNRGCNEQGMLQRDLDRHVSEQCHYRLVPCSKCHINVPLANMQEHLATTCMEVVHRCPNGCGKDIKRREMDLHRLESCPNVLCICPYHVYSCEYDGTREEVDKHCTSDSQQHLAMVAAHFKSMTEKMQSVEQVVQSQAQTIGVLQSKLQVTEAKLKQVSEAQAAMAASPALDAASLLADPDFQTSLSKIVEARMQEKVSSLQVEMQNAVEPIEERSKQAVDQCERLKVQNRETGKNLTQLGLTAARSDAALAEVDLRLLAVETNSYNGLIIFKINNFARRHEEAKSGRRVSLYSPTFYTSRHGYKVCLRVYLNGDGSGKGSHVSVFFTIMKGEFDSLLEWPFRAKVTFAVLDQGIERRHRIESFIPDPRSSSFQRPINDMNIASGCPKMISHSDLHNKQNSYLREDCLYIRASVDPSVCGRMEY